MRTLSTLVAVMIGGCFLAFSAVTLVLRGQEKVTLDASVIAEYRLEELSLKWAVPNCHIYVVLASLGTPSRSLSHTYVGPEVCVLLRALNKADLTTVSLQRRIINRLIADKVIVGTVSGTPE